MSTVEIRTPIAATRPNASATDDPETLLALARTAGLLVTLDSDRPREVSKRGGLAACVPALRCRAARRPCGSRRALSSARIACHLVIPGAQIARALLHVHAAINGKICACYECAVV